MAEDDGQDEKRQNRVRRAASFFARRGRLDTAFDGSRKAAGLIGDLAGKIRPKPFDRQGLTGRYRDGGIERFQEMAQGMSAMALEDQHRGWCLQRSWFQYAALGAILAIPIGLVFFAMSRFIVFGLVALFLFALFRAIRADYFAWIIEQGRFGGFFDYLTTRLPRNMQVLMPERHRRPGRGGDL